MSCSVYEVWNQNWIVDSQAFVGNRMVVVVVVVLVAFFFQRIRKGQY